jgi:hypothetical protein
MLRRPSPRSIVTLIALVAAFGAGMMVTSLGDRRETPASRTSNAVGDDRREVYSPDLRSDPHFLAEQRRNVEMLERYCDTSAEMCPEARAARVAFEKLREDD